MSEDGCRKRSLNPFDPTSISIHKEMPSLSHRSFSSLASPHKFLFRVRLHTLRARTALAPSNAKRISSHQILNNDITIKKNSRLPVLTLGVALLTGFGGYILGEQKWRSEKGGSRSYGDNKSILSAKDELKASGLSVLDDAKMLETYGFSPNSYHPASRHSVIVKV